MKRLSATTRLSSGVAALTLSVLLAAQALDLIPNGMAHMLQGRKELCEAIALRCSSAVQNADIPGVRLVLTEVMTENRDLLSAAVRRADGSVFTQFGNHLKHWEAPPGDESTATHVRVPVYDGPRRWGTIELSFRPVAGEGTSAILSSPLLRLCLFVAAGGFLVYHFYLRRSLQYLDPSAVIPDRVKTMLDTLAEGVLVLDRQQRIVLANQAFAGIAGEPAADLQGVPAARFKWTRPNPDEAGHELPWVDSLQTGQTRLGVALALARGDDQRIFTVNCGPIAGGDGAARGALVTFDDVTSIEKKNAQLRKTLEMLRQSRDEINRQNEELQALATTDPLTGCSNRRSFFAQFDTHWSTSRRYGYPLSVVMVDVDRFKRINDQHGHSVGDQVLQHVAGVLKGLAREGDLVCRYGGEEFCVLLTHTDVDGAGLAAERYRQAIESSMAAGIAVTASLGVSGAELGAASPQLLIDEADKALYAAKQTGRNRVVRWDRMPADLEAEKLAAAAVAAELAGSPAPQAPANQPAPVQASQEPTIPYGAVTALISALRYRDGATAAHSQRVADLCVALAKDRMGVRECFVLEVAALLHDIGKLGVPDAILLKPGPLSDEEWVVMRAHDRMGAEIVAAAFGCPELTRIVQTHHAWFGGNSRDPGLPRGADIPLPSRILSICDAFDAMTTDRVYRKGRIHQAAFEELRRCAGRQFDPQLVEQFIALLSAHATKVIPSPSDAEAAMARVQEQVERLALALEQHDLGLLRAMAGRMAATAGRDGLEGVARAAAELERSAAHHPDVLDVVKKVNELMALCRTGEGTSEAQAPKELSVTAQ